MPGSPLEDGPGGAGRSADVVVTLDAEPAAAAGGVTLATVRTRVARDVVLQGGAVSVHCAVAYRYLEGFFGATYGGTARRGVDVAVHPLPGPTLLREGEHVDQQVLLRVPADAPPTVDCDLVVIAWTVRARVRFEGTGYADAEPVPVVVLGAGRGADTASPVRVHGPRHRDGVTVTGPRSRQFGPGDRIVGEVAVEPSRPGRLESVRAELVLLQQVPHGPWLVDDPARNPEAHPNEAETTLAQAVLAEALPVAPGGPALRWRIELGAPAALPAPTLVTKEFSLRWVLRGVVERRRAQPTRAELELDASTAPPTPAH
jgi:hypothetical protein